MLDIQEKVELSKYTTFGLGGPADFLVVVKTAGELVEALEYAKENRLQSVVLGAGSNVLFHDNGFRGLVIVNRANKYSLEGSEVIGGSGVSLAFLAKKTLDQGLVGLHFGTGIPGTIGGAVVGNAGALGSDISGCLISADIWHAGTVEKWKNADIDFVYRSSKLRGKLDYVVLSATFKLKDEDTTQILKQVQDDVFRRRKSYVGKTCGSYFKNPEGKSAGELIDSLGLKGYRIGGAEISPFHANVIRNVDHATTADILNLEKYIQDKVNDEYNILLVPEVVKIGF